MSTASVTVFVSPVVPNPTGSGLAQRAYRLLTWLSDQAPTHLLLAQPHATPALPAEVTARISGFTVQRTQAPAKVLRLAAVAMPWLVVLNHALATDWLIPTGPMIGDPLPASIARLIVFRLRTHGIASKIPPGPIRHLDLDDLESATLRSIATLAWAQRRFTFACSLRSMSLQYRLLERRIPALYNSVSVANPRDLAQLLGRTSNAKLFHLRNTVPLPAYEPRTMPDPAQPIFLFVGTLDYFPNEDAAEWIAGPICDALRKHLGRPFRIWIAGRGASQQLIDKLARVPEVDFLGEVADLASLYRLCHAVLAAVRGGGGTKIKVLEAIAYGCPTIATPHAVDGLPGFAGEHYLRAHTSEDFVRAARTLIEQPTLWCDLSRAARQLAESLESSNPNLPFAIEKMRAEG